MGDGFEMGKALGTAFSDAVTKGVSEWRSIQLDRQQRKEFDGAMGLAAQRRGMIKSAAGIEEAEQLEQLRAQVQRYPNAQDAERPTGNVREDGAPETEQVIRTPEGDIPIQQLFMLKQRKQQAESNAELAEVDLIMELQARYPQNPYVKQWVASTYSGIQQKQQIRSKQVEAQRLQLDTIGAGLERQKFESEATLARDRLNEQKRQFDAEPGRERESLKAKTDEGIRGDQARISAQKDADIAVEGVKAQNKPERPATEFVKKLQQMAPRALESLKVLDRLDVDRASVGQSAQSALPNFAKSSDRQQFDQAQLEFVTSVLRAESGATITEPEVERDRKKYFPVLGDSPETIAQKRQARKTALVGLYQAAELEAPDLGSRDSEQPRSPDEVRAAFKAGKLGRDEAKALLRTMGR